LSFQLFDSFGKAVFFELYELSTSATLGVQYHFSDDDLPKGIYLLQVNDGEE
jgi:hypothetical protein